MLVEDPLIVDRQAKKEKQDAARRASRRAERIDAKLAEERDKAKKREKEKKREEEEEKKRNRHALVRRSVDSHCAGGRAKLPRRVRGGPSQIKEEEKDRTSDKEEQTPLVLDEDERQANREWLKSFFLADIRPVYWFLFVLSALFAAYATFAKHGSFNEIDEAWRGHAAIFTGVAWATITVLFIKTLLEYFVSQQFPSISLAVRILVNFWLSVAILNFFLTGVAQLATDEISWWNWLWEGKEPFWYMVSDQKRDWEKSFASKVIEELRAQLSLVITERDTYLSAFYKRGRGLLDDPHFIGSVLVPLFAAGAANIGIVSAATSIVVTKTGLGEKQLANAVNVAYDFAGKVKKADAALKGPPPALVKDQMGLLLSPDAARWMRIKYEYIVAFFGVALVAYQKAPQEAYIAITWMSGLYPVHFLYGYMIDSIKAQIQSPPAIQSMGTESVVQVVQTVITTPLQVAGEIVQNFANFVAPSLLPAPLTPSETAARVSEQELDQARRKVFLGAGVCTYGGAKTIIDFMINAKEGPAETAWGRRLGRYRALSINSAIASRNWKLGAKILGYNRALKYQGYWGEIDTQMRWMSSDEYMKFYRETASSGDTLARELMANDIFSPDDKETITEAIGQFDDRISKFFSFEEITAGASLWKKAGFYVDRVVAEYAKGARGYIGVDGMSIMIGQGTAANNFTDKNLEVWEKVSQFIDWADLKRGGLAIGEDCEDCKRFTESPWLLTFEDVDIESWASKKSPLSFCTLLRDGDGRGGDGYQVCQNMYILTASSRYNCYGGFGNLDDTLNRYCFAGEAGRGNALKVSDACEDRGQ
jgi:hypothetical protein